MADKRRSQKRKSGKAKSATKRQATDPAQYKRFVELARELGADDSPEAFERAFKKVARTKRSSS